MIVELLMIASALDLEIRRQQFPWFHMAVNMQNIVLFGMNGGIARITRQSYRSTSSVGVMLDQHKFQRWSVRPLDLGNSAKMLGP